MQSVALQASKAKASICFLKTELLILKALFLRIFQFKNLMTLQVCIMTPDRVFFNESAEEIVLPTNTGQMGVLQNHAPLVTGLEVGVMLLRSKNEWTQFALMGGFAIVKQNKVTILVNSAESAETVDATQAEKTFLDAQKRLAQVLGQKDKVEANFAFKRARVRYQLVKNK